LSVALIAGDDDLLLLRATEQQLAKLSNAYPDMEWQQYDVSEIELLPEMRTASLFATRTGIVLRGVESVTATLKTALEEYVSNPSPDTDLVLVARGLGKIPKLSKLVSDIGERIDVKLPSQWDDRGWDQLVTDEFRRHGRSCDVSAIAAIRDYAGLSATQVASQVRTVIASTTATQVTREHVTDVLTVLREGSAFAVADAYVGRNPGEAIVAVRAAMRAGIAPLAIVGALVWRTRQLLLARGGASASDAGVRSENQWRTAKKDAARFTSGELAWCHDRLAQLDTDLKSVDASDAVVLELGVLEIATSRHVSAPFNPLATTQSR